MQKIRALLLLLTMLLLIGTVVPNAVYADPDPLTATLYPSDDAWVDQHYPTSNHGTGFLEICGYRGYNYYALVRFDLSSISSGAIISSATLRIYIRNCHLSGTVGAYRITAPWLEGTVTWDNQPGHEDTATASTIVIGGPGVEPHWETLDVTSDVQAFVSGTKDNYGWKLITYELRYFTVGSAVLEVTYTLLLPTTMTVDCDPVLVAPGGSTTMSGQLTSGGTSLSGKPVDLYYAAADSPTGEPTGPWTKITTVTTGTDGAYSHMWSPVPGQVCNYWAVMAIFPGDTDYASSSAKTGLLNIPNVHVIPEVPLGTATTLASMMVALATAMLYKRKIVRLPPI